MMTIYRMQGPSNAHQVAIAVEWPIAELIARLLSREDGGTYVAIADGDLRAEFRGGVRS